MKWGLAFSPEAPNHRDAVFQELGRMPGRVRQLDSITKFSADAEN